MCTLYSMYVKYNGSIVATVNCKRLKYGSNAFDLYDILHACINVATVEAAVKHYNFKLMHCLRYARSQFSSINSFEDTYSCCETMMQCSTAIAEIFFRSAAIQIGHSIALCLLAYEIKYIHLNQRSISMQIKNVHISCKKNTIIDLKNNRSIF